MEVTTLIRTVGLDLLKPALPQRQLDGHKGTFGKLFFALRTVSFRQKTGKPDGFPVSACRKSLFSPLSKFSELHKSSENLGF